MEQATDLWDVALPYWQAFWVLQRNRPVAVGIAAGLQLPLLYSELSLYARDHGLLGDDLDEFVELIQRMDDVYLNHVQEREQQRHGRR
jgi:hypothetical protein